MLLMCSPLQAEEDLPLPRWEQRTAEQQAAAQQEVGRSLQNLLPLLPENPAPLPSGPRLQDASPSLMPGDSELRAHDLGLFLPNALLHQPLDQAQTDSTAQRSPTPSTALRDLPAELIRSMNDLPANQYLVDPQSLLSEVPQQDLQRLLEFHNGQARIQLYVMVMDADQTLPLTAEVGDFAHGALKNQPSCLLVYPLAEPWRARLLMNRSIHDATQPATLSEMLQDCVRDAQQAELSTQQLQRFNVRLSTRLFWLERSLTQNPVTGERAELDEVLGTQSLSASMAQRLDSAFKNQTRIWQAIALILSLGAVGLAFFTLKTRQRRPKKHSRQPERVWILPEAEELPSRLGGTYCGGACASVSFQIIR
jgi:hypothetical protein